jgi:hypothetical protein
MNKRSFSSFLLILLLSFSACSPNPKEAFESLKKLEGQWKSTGNVIVYESWRLENDSLLTGYKFAKRGENKMVLERYHLERKSDSVLFVILRPAKAIGEDRYPLVKSWFEVYTFENPEAVYPNRILLDFDNDSVFVSRKENIRGNKRIEFEMKKWKE